MQTSPLLAKVSATTGRTVLSIDETIVLKITSENGSGEPDISKLETNFQILGRSQSQNYSLINGHASSTQIWSITLLPKKIGEITIPEIQVGNEKTQAIHLVIQKQSSTPGLDGKNVFLKIELSDMENTAKGKQDIYVQQQILVKIQLFHRIRFTNATLSNLELDNTVVEKLGNDNNYSKVIANHRYNITEQNYAIYPQQSGTLTIPALTFTANAEISQNFSLFSRPGRKIISRTKPITLNILPIPEKYTGKYWLPAENLVIESKILEDRNTINSGEAITRHIVVRATGLLGSQLPASNMSSSQSIKTYPDKEKLNAQIVDGKVVGSRRDTIAIIPLKAGRFILPEIKIDWWNTKTHQQQTAILPAQSLLAQQNPELEKNNTEPKSSEPVNQAQQVPIKDKENKEVSSEKSFEKIISKESELEKNPWFWISFALLIIWLITLALMFTLSSKRKRLQHDRSPNKDSDFVNKNHEKYLHILYEQCQENNANKATKALVQWAKHYFDKPMLIGLSQIGELVDNKDLINTISDLESSLYSVNKRNWSGDALSSAITDFIKQDTNYKNAFKQEKSQAFSPLNP